MNKYYGDLVFCPSCRKIVSEAKILYECEITRGSGDSANSEKHRISMNRALGRSESELTSAQGDFHYYFRRPPLRMFRKKNGDAICPVCRRSSSRMVCSECFNALTTTAKRTEVISVVGFKGCGKTVYIAALINEIGKYSDTIGIERTVEMVTEGNYNLQEGERLPGGTPSGKVEPVRIHLGSRENGDGKYPLDLIIYDIAGEDLSKPGASMELFHHLSMSSLIIYLFDPFTKRYYKNDHAGWAGRPEITEHFPRRMIEGKMIENDGIIDLIIDQIRKNYMNDLQVTKLGSRKLPIYMAACISSSDFLRWKNDAGEHYTADEDIGNSYYEIYRAIDFIHPDACITPATFEKLEDNVRSREKKIERWKANGSYGDPNSKGIRRTIEWMQRDSETAVFLRLGKWGEGNACRKLGHFKEVSYFGVSSLGTPPTKSGEEFVCPVGYEPRNVINPLLWFFKKEGILELLTKQSS